MKYEIIVTVDSNDADYLTEISTISQKDLDFIRPLIVAIKEFKSYKGKDYESTATREPTICSGHTYHHNYPNGEYCPREDMGEYTLEEIYPAFDEEVFEAFEEFCPYGEYGYHTIKSVTVSPVPKREVLL